MKKYALAAIANMILSIIAIMAGAGWLPYFGFMINASLMMICAEICRLTESSQIEIKMDIEIDADRENG